LKRRNTLRWRVDKKKADVRIIAATNKDLDSEVKKGNFRDDLYFRLNVVKLSILPKERKEDILPLLRFFINRFNEQFKKGFVQISKEAEEKILFYPWTGNIRELRNAVERIVLLEKGDTILGKHLSFLSKGTEPPEEGVSFKPHLPSQGIVLDEVEKHYILEALKIKKEINYRPPKCSASPDPLSSTVCKSMELKWEISFLLPYIPINFTDAD